jgi:cytochrome c-type biogenesis protein CcmE
MRPIAAQTRVASPKETREGTAGVVGSVDRVAMVPPRAAAEARFEIARRRCHASVMPRWVPIAIVLVSLSGLATLLLLGTGTSSPFVYSKLVDEVMADPGSFMDRELRVEGELRQGSIQFREEPCEWRFVLQKGDHEMAVAFPECVVPDTFRDGMGISVTVQGQLQDDHSFLANQVVPRCPSKYEMQQRQRNGEATPHAMEPPTGLPPTPGEG